MQMRACMQVPAGKDVRKNTFCIADECKCGNVHATCLVCTFACARVCGTAAVAVAVAVGSASKCNCECKCNCLAAARMCAKRTWELMSSFLYAIIIVIIIVIITVISRTWELMSSFLYGRTESGSLSRTL